jgi:hypothetical protein
MAFTTADLAAVESALASGELSVQYADRRVQYRSVAELTQAREMIIKELDAAAGKRRPRAFRLNVSKGA